MPKLSKGDRIAVIATSRSVTPEQLTFGLKLISEWGFEAVFGQNMYQQYCQGYSYAGTKEQRFSDLQWAIKNSDVKAIWFAAGGYGANHLIENLDLTEFKKHPKWLIGYSDITVLHQYFNTKGIPTIHGTVLKQLNNIKYNPETYSTIKNVLLRNEFSYEIESHPLNIQGKEKGILLGGNLSILYSLLASPYAIQNQEFILLIEDWYENWYHVDRMMNALKMSGLLNRTKAVIIGNFTRMDVKEENKEFNSSFDSKSYEIIYENLKPYNIPLCFGFPSGHTGDNRALVLGKEIKLDVIEKSCVIHSINH